jgi:hypothetical protein
MAGLFSDGLENPPMDDDQDRGDNAATVMGIGVSLLVLLTGALVCIVCFGLVMMLLHIGLYLQTF